ncbi:MAG TPA: hypothetical protein DCS97_11205 [Planctomycetes bacterium]|nr:hypothetical protein [Planctomycetota bacterium]
MRRQGRDADTQTHGQRPVIRSRAKLDPGQQATQDDALLIRRGRREFRQPVADEGQDLLRRSQTQARPLQLGVDKRQFLKGGFLASLGLGQLLGDGSFGQIAGCGHADQTADDPIGGIS